MGRRPRVCRRWRQRVRVGVRRDRPATLQRTGRRSSTHPLNYAPGDVAGSLTGELAYDIRDTIPGNVVRGKPMLRKRMPFWYLDLVKKGP